VWPGEALRRDSERDRRGIAADQATTKILCGRGFKECGLFPFNVEIVLASGLVRTVDPAPAGADPEMGDRAGDPTCSTTARAS
jgi:hypothetical protein